MKRKARSEERDPRRAGGVSPLKSRVQKMLAWSVHFYTALGLAAAALIALLIVQGTGVAIRWAFVLMVVATLIDATDGTLARAVKIKEVLPNFDGRKLDDIVDFLNYTCLPLFLLWRVDILPSGQAYWLLLPLFASAYGFCQVSAKTDDGYFLGFPSYWNLVAFYLYVLQPLPGWIAVALLVVFSVLTFVPSRYLYPSQRGKLNRVTNLLGGAWTGLLLWIMMVLPEEVLSPTSSPDSLPRRLALLSLFFPVYYLAASWIISLKIWKRKRRAHEPLEPALAPKG